MKIEPIITNYKNYKFRSRTEARWAVFFDTIGFKWQYEEDGYTLQNGRRYLPDFKLFLPNDKIFYVEVKPLNFDKDESKKEIIDYRLFSKSINQPIIILTGQPDFLGYDVIFPHFDIPREDELSSRFALGLFQDYEPYIRIADEYWWQYIELDTNTGIHKINVDSRQAGKSFGNRYLKAINESKKFYF